ncbi:MAG: hypothetical protein J0L75_02715 [Spirochaetes bacterium]|nr:hypothetical protein [Spirochaetota bacterium]
MCFKARLLLACLLLIPFAGAQPLRVSAVSNLSLYAAVATGDQTNGLLPGELFDLYRGCETNEKRMSLTGFVDTVAYVGARPGTASFRYLSDETLDLAQSGMFLVPAGRRISKPQTNLQLSLLRQGGPFSVFVSADFDYHPIFTPVILSGDLKLYIPKWFVFGVRMGTAYVFSPIGNSNGSRVGGFLAASGGIGGRTPWKALSAVELGVETGTVFPIGCTIIRAYINGEFGGRILFEASFGIIGLDDIVTQFLGAKVGYRLF